ncbi:MAG: ABC transporter permease, partial [Planctomycetia bacterium 21-64-5]
MCERPNYLCVFLTFAKNSLVRDMTFRANFIYVLIFEYTGEIGARTGWHKYEFFVFLATTLFINSLVQTFFMPNANEFSELIRSGNLDFALLKPIDTQFLISLQRVEWSSLANFVFAGGLLGYSLARLSHRPPVLQMLLYPVYVACGVAVLYSLMIVLSSVSVWS